MKNIAVMILAGGESSRMKRPKAFLKFDENYTFLEKIIYEYSATGIKNIILIINTSAISSENNNVLLQLEKKVTIIYNKHSEKGRLYSLNLGLSILNKSQNCFIQNIDNPFVNSDLIKKMVQKIKKGFWVSPNFKGKGGHPILLSSSICRTILENNDKSTTLRKLLESFDKIIIPSNKSILTNINTVNDYTKHFS